MANLNIGSFHVKGLADEKKRKEVFNWLREKKMNVYMLQETHFTKENENIIEAEWGFNVFFLIVHHKVLELLCLLIIIFNLL
jgi:exonuclease III